MGAGLGVLALLVAAFFVRNEAQLYGPDEEPEAPAANPRRSPIPSLS